MESQNPAFTLVLALAAGVAAQAAARHLRIPGIVVLLVTGLALGPDGLGWVLPHALGEGLFTMVELAVAIIVFEGGLNLELSRLRRAQSAIRMLVTVGALVTLVGGGVVAHYWLDWGWMQALLFGSLVVVTGPTVIGPLISTLRLRQRPATVLEAEGVLIDPIGAILAVLVLEIALAPAADTLASGGLAVLARVAVGASAGVLGGFLLAWLLGFRKLLPEGHENIFVLAFVLLLFQGCEELVSHSGILAVALAGAVLGNLNTRVDRDVREFKDQLTVLLIGLLFVTLAADVRVEQVQDLGWPGIAVVASLVLVVRPLGVWLSTLGSDLSVKERLFISWIAPRGIVAAAIASVVASTVEREGLGGGVELRALVFLTITGTVVLAGLTAAPVGRLLGVRLPGREGYVILGAHSVGVALAQALREGGTATTFVDSNPQNCRRVQEAGFPVVFGNAMRETTLARARAHSVAGAIALTTNKTLNAVFVTRARDLFSVPEGMLAAESLDAGLANELIDAGRARLAFDGPHDLERWEVRHRRGDVAYEHWRKAGEAAAEEGEAAEQVGPVGERLIFVAHARGRSVKPWHRDVAPQEDDVAVIGIHEPEREEAERWLAAMGWEPVPEESEAEMPDPEAAAVAQAQPALL